MLAPDVAQVVVDVLRISQRVDEYDILLSDLAHRPKRDSATPLVDYLRGDIKRLGKLTELAVSLVPELEVLHPDVLQAAGIGAGGFRSVDMQDLIAVVHRERYGEEVPE